MHRYSYQIFSILTIVVFVQALELILLLRKYDLFSIGFLQPYSYLTTLDRILFLTTGLWMDSVVFGTLCLIWFWFSKRANLQALIAAYNFIFIASSAIGVWLTIKYKVLSYFNDTINFHIMRSLGGGTFINTFTYAVNEASFILTCILILTIIYWIGLRFLKTKLKGGNFTSIESFPHLLIISTVAIVITVAFTLFINSDSSLRYGLRKKTSYAIVSSFLDTMTDFDLDGYGLFAFPKDPKILDPNIYPGMIDIPNNGADENGYGGDFIFTDTPKDTLSTLPPKPGKHIIIIVLESARADLIGKRFGNRLVSPTLTKLSEFGTNVKFAYTHTGFTTYSLKALFNRTLSEKKDRIGLTDYLRKSGYRLSFISGQDESFGDVAATTGMITPGNYFFDANSAIEDRVVPSKAPASLRLSEERVVRQFFERSQQVDWNRPQFFYLNLQAAHFPYHYTSMPSLINDRPIPRSEISERNREWLEATYWNAITVVDQSVNKIINKLIELGSYDNTAIMILGDHGESLFDDQLLGHGHALNEIQTRIPLIFNQPGLRIGSAIGQTDMAELIVRIATNRLNEKDWDTPHKPIFQVIGGLNNPQLVGIVSSGEVRTILDLRIRKVFFSDLQRWEDFDSAWNDPVLRDRTRALINIWEETRWLNYLSQRLF